MNIITLTALRGSIAKWEAIVAGTGEDRGTANCPLCHMFYHWTSGGLGDCKGCPVMEKTGSSKCVNSPYDEIANLDPDEYPAEYRIFAQRELDFLRSLLPNAAG
jgi:hypothetical protein